ncbi:MAG: RpiB/LacA/LacB family sugar-phosphate isomerase [Vicinamibacteria bacterium]
MSEPNPEFLERSHVGWRVLSRGGDDGDGMMEPSTQALVGLVPNGVAYRVGLAADHGGFALKTELIRSLIAVGWDVVDFGAHELDPADDYPDFVIPLAAAIAHGDLTRGIALCGSGVGVCIVANKFPGVRAGLVHDVYSAHQGVEHDDMNVACLGGTVIGSGLALDLTRVFLNARFSGHPRNLRRLAKVRAIEHLGLLKE